MAPLWIVERSLPELLALPRDLSNEGPDASIHPSGMVDFVTFSGFVPGMPMLRDDERGLRLRNGVRLLEALLSAGWKDRVRCLVRSGRPPAGSRAFSQLLAREGSADVRVLTFSQPPGTDICGRLEEHFGRRPERVSPNSVGWRSDAFQGERDTWRWFVERAEDWHRTQDEIESVNGRYPAWAERTRR